MKDETRLWLVYAQENLASALVLVESSLQPLPAKYPASGGEVIKSMPR